MSGRGFACGERSFKTVGDLSRRWTIVQQLESRVLLSGSNAIDELDFGNLASEAAHDFDPGIALANLPVLGSGTVGASAGLTYRDPTSGNGLTFTLAVDPNKQNYFTVKLWGNDPNETINLESTADVAIGYMEQAGGAVINPNRFYYYTVSIPISMTQGLTSVQLLLAVSAPGKPIYAVYCSTNPDFVPASSAATGTSPTVTGQATLSTLTDSQAMNILLANREAIYGSGGYYSTVVAEQALVLNSTPNANGTYSWTAPAGAPEEVTGLDMFTNLASWMAANPGATADTWDNQIGDSAAGPGYTAFPDQLISALTSTYLLAPLTDPSSGSVLYAAPNYHNPALIARIVAAMDGSSYLQDSDGGFTAQGGPWTGLTSSPRTTGPYAGSSARQGTTWGGGPLEGVDAQTLGWSIIQLLNDPTASPIFQTYLAGSYDANLNGGAVLRATAYEEMLYNHIQYQTWATGGTESQNSFETLDYYATDLALRELQALYPNASYANTAGAGINRIEQLLGLIPDTFGGGVGFNYYSPYSPSTYTNYGLTADGLGEAYGALSSGFDGGGYGQLIPWIASQIATLAAQDPGMSATFPGTNSTILSLVEAKANATINSFDQFISPTYDATVNSSGVVTSDTYGFDPESFITYRDPKNVNTYAGGFNFNSQYLASSPTGAFDNAYALRSAYLETQYGITPITGSTFGGATSDATLNYLRSLSAYESTIESLINVNPSTLTPLPDEPGQPGYAFADVQDGAVAIVNNGDQLFMNINWRNYDSNGYTLVNLVPSQILRYDYTTSTIERAGEVELPYNSATVQSDGNLSATSMFGVDIARLGNYLVVLNDSTSAYSAKLPMGIGLAEDLISHNVYPLSTSSSSPATVSVAAGKAAILWLNAASVISSLGTGTDVGAVGVTGSDSYSNGVYTVTGAGADIGETADAFHFVPISVSGNETITAQVLTQTAVSSLAQAGVMLRDGTSAGAAFAAVVRTPGGGVRFVYRTTAGAETAWTAVPDPLSQVYVKLTRSGSNVSGYYSSDGNTWTQIGATQSIGMTNPEIGLAVSSHSTTATSTATFGNVTVNAVVAPTVATAASASATMVTGTTVNLSVLGADAGGESGLTYSWMLLGTPPDQVAYSSNGTNAAKNTTVTFSTAGTYGFLVVIQNASGAYATSTVSVNVNQTLTSISISPTTAPVPDAGTQLFYATESDQFDMPMITPQALTWSISSGGIGTIDQSGLYTAPASGGGSATILATSGTRFGTSAVTIQPLIGSFTSTQAINTSPAGSASYNSSTSTYTVTGSGSDIWGTSDQFQYVYEPLTGDGTITVYVASLTDTNAWTKVGIMVRDSLNPNGAYAFLMTTPTTTEGNAFQYRSGDGSSSGQNIQTTGTGTGGPGWLRLVKSGNTFTAYLSTNGTTWIAYGTPQTVSMGSTIYVGLVVCSHDSGVLATATFTNFSLTPATRTFAANEDIGSPSPAGSYSESSGAVTLTSGGADIWGTSDQFQYGYNEISGNGSITLEVDSITDPSPTTKAGIMLRNTLAANSANVSIFVTPSAGIEFQWRSNAGSSTSQSAVTGLTAPYYLRLTDASSSFTAFYSSNGTAWTQIGAAEIVTMNADMFVGVALTSHDSGTLATAVFNSITNTFASASIPPPILSKAATASSNPVTGKTVVLSATGTDPVEGNSSLIYTWSTLGEPPAPMTFSANGTNAAASTTVTFTAAGTYLFQVSIADPNGLQVTSTVSVTVNQTLTSIALIPAASTIVPGSTVQFSAIALDQFANALAAQPSFLWSLVSGGGNINSSTGSYIAPVVSSSATISATSGGINGNTTVSIINQSPLVATSVGAAATPAIVAGTMATLSVPAVDDAGAANLSYGWTATGPASVSFSPNGTNAASAATATFSEAGTYDLTVTITDSGGLTTTSTVAVTVNQILTSVSTSPNPVTVAGGNSVSFSATGFDQFGAAMISQPTFSWSTTGGGSINSAGVFTASQSGGTYTIMASDGVSATASVNVVPTIYSAAGNYDVSQSGGIEQIVIASGPTYSISASSLPLLMFDGPASNLTVDFTNGDTVPAGGLSFINGNSLTIIGTNGNDAVTVNGTTVSFNSDLPITYTNIQSITVSGGSGADVFTQSAQPGGGATLAFTPTSADTLNINGGNYAVPSPAANSGFNAYPLAALSIASGASMTINTAAASTDRTVLGVGNLSISSTGQLDLGGNDMIVHSAASGESVFGPVSTAGTIENLVATGRDNGTWTGSGITSSAAAASPTIRALAVVLNDINQAGMLSGIPLVAAASMFNNGLATFDGQTVADGDVLVKFTSYGDALLNSNVTAADYAQIDNGFNSLAGSDPLTGWYNGDFNDDGQINGDDYTLIDNAFNSQDSMQFEAVPAIQIAQRSTKLSKIVAAIPPFQSIDSVARMVSIGGIGSAIVTPFSTVAIGNGGPQNSSVDLLDDWRHRRVKAIDHISTQILG